MLHCPHKKHNLYIISPGTCVNRAGWRVSTSRLRWSRVALRQGSHSTRCWTRHTASGSSDMSRGAGTTSPWKHTLFSKHSFKLSLTFVGKHTFHFLCLIHKICFKNGMLFFNNKKTHSLKIQNSFTQHLWIIVTKM